MWITVESEGRRHRLAVARAPQGVWVGYPGGSILLLKQDPAHAAGGAENADLTVRAPMTGKVVQVRVKAGGVVQANDVLVVLEAMKMEYRLTASVSGTVADVQCKEGELVDLGSTLVTLAP